MYKKEIPPPSALPIHRPTETVCLQTLFLNLLKPSSCYYTPSSHALMYKRGIIEKNEDVAHALRRTVKALLTIDTHLNGGIFDQIFADNVIRLTNSGTLVFGTAILTNAGRDRTVTAACTVLPLHIQDGLLDLMRFRADAMSAFSNALGTGYDLSVLPSPSRTIRELNPILDELNQTLVLENRRPAASMITLRADHPDIIAFIRTKRDVDFSSWRCNISVFVTEQLFTAAETDQFWALRDNNNQITNTISARELLNEIAASAHYCGEPGLLFKDRLEQDNPTPHWNYKSTAPCAEIAMAEGEACQFSYINVATCIKANGQFDATLFGTAVASITRLLDASVDQTIAQSHELGLSLVGQKRRIGVGIMGFADLLIMMKIPYDDARAFLLATQISELLDYHSKHISVELAKKRGAFPAFAISRFTDTTWAQRKMGHCTGVVPPHAWNTLFENMRTSGIRHASTTALPPTGTSSTIVGASPSLEPLFTLTDGNGNLRTAVQQALLTEPDHLARLIRAHLAEPHAIIRDEELLAAVPYLRTARQISPAAHIRMQGAFQKFLDEALAKTVNLPRHATHEEVLQILWEVYHDGLKGITVFRDGCLQERGRH